jgi:predicted GNAT superfamily acetyltransferase
MIAIQGDKVIGFSFGVIERLSNANMLYWEWAGVNPTYRKTGVMQSIWDNMELWVKDKGLDGILVDTLMTNNKMINFLQKNQMKIWREMKNHWYGQDYFLCGKLYG